ncbi:hypothetical protein WJX84_012237 [Apatococcus fuscideae]|uniref:Uncharacterized protein n=1 Tax=Apatococcus fuscideae TaxID=2026836 RepID=A0AAW1SRG1_9CHLO
MSRSAHLPIRSEQGRPPEGPRAHGNGPLGQGPRGVEGPWAAGHMRGQRPTQFHGPPAGSQGIGRGPQLQQWGQAAQALNPAQQQQLLQYGSAHLQQGASLSQQQRQQLQLMLQGVERGGMGQGLGNGMLGLPAQRGAPPAGPPGMNGMWAGPPGNQSALPPPPRLSTGPSHRPMNGAHARPVGNSLMGGMGHMSTLPLPPNFEKLLHQGGLGALPLPPGMSNGNVPSMSGLPSGKRHLPADALASGGPPSSKPRLDGSLPLPLGHPRAWPSSDARRPHAGHALIDGRPMLAGEDEGLGTLDGGRRASHGGMHRQPAGPRPPHGPPHAMPPDWDQAQPAALGGGLAGAALGKPDKFLKEQAAVVQREEAQLEAERKKQEVQAKIEAQREENRRIIEEQKLKQQQQLAAEKAAEEERKKRAEIALMRRRIALLEAQQKQKAGADGKSAVPAAAAPSAAPPSAAAPPAGAPANEPQKAGEPAAIAATAAAAAAAAAPKGHPTPAARVSDPSQIQPTATGDAPQVRRPAASDASPVEPTPVGPTDKPDAIRGAAATESGPLPVGGIPGEVPEPATMSTASQLPLQAYPIFSSQPQPATNGQPEAGASAMAAMADQIEPAGSPSAEPDKPSGKEKHRQRSKSKHRHKEKSEKAGKEHRRKRKHRSRTRSRSKDVQQSVGVADALPAAVQDLPTDQAEPGPEPAGGGLETASTQPAGAALAAVATGSDLRERLIALRQAKAAAKAAAPADAAARAGSSLRSLVSLTAADGGRGSEPAEQGRKHQYERPSNPDELEQHRAAHETKPSTHGEHDRSRSRHRQNSSRAAPQRPSSTSHAKMERHHHR